MKYLILIGLVFSIILISGCVEKGCEITSDCANKTCFAVECKDNNCVYSPIVDCLNCDDANECTIDSYDYQEQKCVNELIDSCCGNGICDEGAETYSDCPIDCPNCDDDNRLTADSFNYITQKCEHIVTEKGPENCPDGTLYGGCSVTKPKYCDDGNLVDKCSACGCGAGQSCQANGSCITECEKIDNLDERDECYYNLVIATKDVLICEKISDPRKDWCYYIIAKALKNASLCDKINTSAAKVQCYKERVSDCEKIETPEEKIACYMQVGGGLKGYVTYDKERGVSYAGYSICGIINEEIRQKCYEEQHKECEKIEEEDERSECYFYLGMSSKDASFCGKITYRISTAIGGRDYCYSQIGMVLNDSSICEKIEDIELRDHCLEQATCIPDWQCSDWSECIRGGQTRICTNLNSCYIGKPSESQSCIPIQPIGFLTYENLTYGIRIQYPQDWTKKEFRCLDWCLAYVGFLLPEEDADMVFSRDGIGFVVDVRDISAQPVTLDEHAQPTIDLIEMAGGDLIEYSNTTLANNPARKLVYEWRTYVDLKIMSFFTIKDNKLYILKYTAEPYRYSKYLDDANEMVNSFEII